MAKRDRGAVDNVILITTDQQHYRTLGVTGTTEAQTPNLDDLAQRGLLYRNHFVANPVCSPSRGCFMTGRLPTSSGLWGNGCALPHDVPTIADAMREAGFETAHFGKLHLEPIITRTQRPHSYGFDHCQIGEGDQHLLSDDYHNWLRSTHPQTFLSYDVQLFDGGHDRAYRLDLPEELTLTNWVVDNAIDFLRDRAGTKPFFLNLGFFDPHHAWNPVDPYFSRFSQAAVCEPRRREGEHRSRPKYYHRFDKPLLDGDRERLNGLIRAYHAMMAHIDTQIGRLIETLHQLGLAERTAVLVTSDHGEMLGNHEMLFKGPYLLDDLLHVPLIASVPGVNLGGRTIDGLTSMVDLFSTVQELGGVERPIDSSGRPFLDRELAPLPHGGHEYVLAEWESASESGNNSLRCIRTESAKLVHYGNDPETGELYDLAADPDEFTNRYHDHQYADLRSGLERRLRKHYGDQPLNFRPNVPFTGAW